jgi:DNA-binding transcriptional LysR family regulator
MHAILDIELVRTFHAVARIGKFKAAAQTLHKSPAAISMHIQRLEAVAGGRLLERDNQAVSLTALGKRLLVSTTELLGTHDRVLAQLHGKHLAGRVKLGVPDEYAAHVIRDILPIFTDAWPNVILEVTTAPSLTLREQIQRGKLHAALVARPSGEQSDSAQVIVATTPVWVSGAAARVDSAEPLPLAVYAADCPYRRAMLVALKEAGRSWRVVLDTASSQAVKACVEAGLAISLMDRAQVSERMRILDDLPAVAEHEVVLLCSQAAQADEAAQLLARTLHQYFRL